MCIRDRHYIDKYQFKIGGKNLYIELVDAENLIEEYLNNCCLLYTSDAADERSSVDLGGRRIIKKKKTDNISRGPKYNTKYN